MVIERNAFGYDNLCSSVLTKTNALLIYFCIVTYQRLRVNELVFVCITVILDVGWSFWNRISNLLFKRNYSPHIFFKLF